jgi:hypothetical protein
MAVAMAMATAMADYRAMGATGVAAMMFAFLSMASSAACLTGNWKSLQLIVEGNSQSQGVPFADRRLGLGAMGHGAWENQTCQKC